MSVRTLAARLLTVLLAGVLVACSSGGDANTSIYGAPSAKIGESQSLLGWNVSVSNLRFEADQVLVDVDMAAAKAGGEHAKPEALRFGLYGAVAHPIESNVIGGCDGVPNLKINPAVVQNPDKITGTVCLGPMRDQAQVRGIYLYSPADRIKDTTVAYGAAYPVGLTPTNEADTGLSLKATSVDGFRADGGQLIPAALGDPAAFTGKGYMLLGLEITGAASRYKADSAKRGGPLMIAVSPTMPPPGLSHACDIYGSTLLMLPDASLGAISTRASLCTQGDINQALLYATVTVVGTHAAVWVSRA
ncbi:MULTISPECIES: hypothetical protein [unclassified Mycolicibacterium]|uniref:hypothetical protein n=1 Tax=unclassified Mycolicibacterium TaxID=2636767 RepID=UPI001391B2EE|nr:MULTISPECIES: hypothetical protein [unclassified Mycolicibacterium]MUM08590.1 hypothetical protein [Mycolicibacterium sp. CBMA 213]